MGCFGSKEEEQPQDEFTDISSGGGGGGPVDSLDAHVSEVTIQKTINKEDFWIRNRTGEVIFRPPGTINGLQFILEDLTDCDVWLFDHCDTVTVDRCSNCRIFIGPTESSVFLRNCAQSQFVIAAQQLRTRDCEDSDLLLYSFTKPIIESSKKLRLGCWRLGDIAYPGIAKHFAAAKMDPYSSYWSQVHDFTPEAGNYSLLPPTTTASSLLKNAPPAIGVAPSADDVDLVPPTCGASQAPSGDACFVLFYHSKDQQLRQFWHRLLAENEGSTIVQTRRMDLNQTQRAQLFEGLDLAGKYDKYAAAGTVTGLHLAGAGITTQVAGLATTLGYNDDVIFISGSTEDAEDMVNLYFTTWVPLY